MAIDLATLGRRLEEARENRRLTQEQAAQAIGASPPTLAHIEAGRRLLSTLELSQLARLYNLPVADFFAEEGAQTSRDERWDSLKNTDREHVSQIVRLAIEAYRRDEVSQGWLRDLSDRLGIPADELLQLAEAAVVSLPPPS